MYSRTACYLGEKEIHADKPLEPLYAAGKKLPIGSVFRLEHEEVRVVDGRASIWREGKKIRSFGEHDEFTSHGLELVVVSEPDAVYLHTTS